MSFGFVLFWAPAYTRKTLMVEAWNKPGLPKTQPHHGEINSAHGFW